MIELSDKDKVVVLIKDGMESYQLISPHSSQSRRITLTEVHVRPGYYNERHSHETSEQVWYALRGTGMLLLAGGEEKPFKAGDVVRMADGDIHGLHNDSDGEFVYIAITSPPVNFDCAYQGRKPQSD